VCIHTFPLDADSDYCSCPPCCPGKEVMFHIPSNFSTHLDHFIPYEDGKKMLQSINRRLKWTGYPNRTYNLYCIFMILFILVVFGIWGFIRIPQYSSLADSLVDDDDTDNKEHGKEYQDLVDSSTVEFIKTHEIVILVCSGVVPAVLYLLLICCMKSCRRSFVTGYIQKWNRRQNNGVFLSIGGEGMTRRGVAVGGGPTGGSYDAFYLATWDPKGYMFHGYLNVFVNYEARAEWCRDNRVMFVPPVPPHQQNQQQQQPAGFQPPPHPGQSPNNFQVPEGYALVPQSQVHVPEGYVMVPKSTIDAPPSYEETKDL